MGTFVFKGKGSWMTLDILSGTRLTEGGTFMGGTSLVRFLAWRSDVVCHLQSVTALLGRPQSLGCHKWGCNKWGLKGCLAALPGNRPKSAKIALFLPFSPFSGGCQEHLGNPEKRRKKAFFLRYPRILLTPRGHKPPFAALQKVPTKSLFGQEAPKIGARKCSSKRGVWEPLNLEIALNDRELVKTVGGRKTAQEKKKKQIPGNGGSQELFGPMFPWFCLFSLSFQWEEVQKFPGTLFLGTFFSYFRWFFSLWDRSVREKSVRANGPTKIDKIKGGIFLWTKGAFSLNKLLVGTVQPPKLSWRCSKLWSALRKTRVLISSAVQCPWRP